MLYYCSMGLHYCKKSPKKKKNVTRVQVQILCKSCASIFPCFTLFFQKLFRLSHEKRSFSRFQPDFSRYFGYFPVPFGVGVVEAASSSLVTQTKIGGSTEPPIFFYFLANSLEISRFCDIDYRNILPFLSGRLCLFLGNDDMLDHRC